MYTLEQGQDSQTALSAAPVKLWWRFGEKWTTQNFAPNALDL